MSKKLTNNYIFRKFTCGLSKIETANLCFKTVRTVTRWDCGQEIPPECRRLMKMYAGRQLGALDDSWQGWKINKEELIIPGGWSLTPDRIITGNALLEINTEKDSQQKAQIMRAARLLTNLTNIKTT